MSMPVMPEIPAATPSPKRGRWWLWTGAGLVLVASFAVSLAANAPARQLVQRLDLALAEDAVSGTVMHGQIALDGGFALRWDVRPWASLTTLRLAADVTLQGPQTGIGGPVAVGLSSYDIGPVAGSADAAVLRAIFPGIDLRCAGPVLAAGLQVTLTRQTFTGTGSVRTDRLTCGAAVIPAMALSFAPVAAGSVATVTAGPVPVITATAAGDGRLAVVLHKEGAALIPGLPSSADSSIELPLSSFFP